MTAALLRRVEGGCAFLGFSIIGFRVGLVTYYATQFPCHVVWAGGWCSSPFPTLYTSQGFKSSSHEDTLNMEPRNPTTFGMVAIFSSSAAPH